MTRKTTPNDQMPQLDKAVHVRSAHPSLDTSWCVFEYDGEELFSGWIAQEDSFCCCRDAVATDREWSVR
jgi:hypothetical protein